MTRIPEPTNLQDLLDRYEVGESINLLAKEAGVSRPYLTTRLRNRGVAIRGSREQQGMSLQRIPAEEKKRWASYAHAGVRGKRQTVEHRLKIACTRERKQIGVSRLEELLAEALLERGCETIMQKAVGPYNVDIALAEAPVAVEVFGGHWHAGGRHAARHKRRCEHILNAGWHLVIVWVTKWFPLEPPVADQIVALAKFARRHPTAKREYRVMYGNGKPATIGERNFNSGTVIPRAKRSKD